MARRICAWCKITMGECVGEVNTHGVCPECCKKSKMEAEELKKKLMPGKAYYSTKVT